jgi:hypothetical protein
VTDAYTARARTLVTKMMFWALARVTFSAAKIVSCNKIFFTREYTKCTAGSTFSFVVVVVVLVLVVVVVVVVGKPLIKLASISADS